MRFTITLSRNLMERLARQAQRDYRFPRHQAEFYVSRAIEQEDLRTEDAPNTALDEEVADAPTQERSHV